ncbi:hypothetical protein SAMN04487950_2631 [Halogranum rubrum]|uniref:Uncharacterized protein n=1 Tax=Halogranum rubrum TaxID=553466 RepID=A0A1I4F4X2_9EURY|nr:hypothetical protein [Halogranum rubrum]SFL12974.1 hypothetical protein SAMN04487950_2631 [Halogranum rubrum]
MALPPRRRGTLTVLLGFVLLLNPFVVGYFDIGDPDRYEYQAYEVSFTEQGTAEIPREVDTVDPQIACLDGLRPSRACVLEQAVHEDGGVWYDGPPATFIYRQYDYVFVWEKGFFTPVAEEYADRPVRYDMKPVATSEALDRVSTEYEDADRAIQYTIRAGNYTARDPIDGANELVERDGQYYVVDGFNGWEDDGDGGRSDLVVLAQWLLGIAGARLILEGQRTRVEAEA